MSFDPALRHLIAAFRKSPNWDEELDLHVLQQLWPVLVGAQLAGSTRVTGVQGARVVVSGRNADRGKQVVSELGEDRAIFHQGDATTKERF